MSGSFTLQKACRILHALFCKCNHRGCKGESNLTLSDTYHKALWGELKKLTTHFLLVPSFRVSLPHLTEEEAEAQNQAEEEQGGEGSLSNSFHSTPSRVLFCCWQTLKTVSCSLGALLLLHAQKAALPGVQGGRLSLTPNSAHHMGRGSWLKERTRRHLLSLPDSRPLTLTTLLPLHLSSAQLCPQLLSSWP